MANPITWQNVATPDFRGSLEGLRIAGQSFDRASSGMSDALTRFDTSRRDEANSALINNTLNYATPEALQAAQASGELFNGVNRGLLTPVAAAALDGRATSMLNQASTRQQISERTEMQPLRVAHQGLVNSGLTQEQQQRGETHPLDLLERRTRIDGMGIDQALGRGRLVDQGDATTNRRQQEDEQRLGIEAATSAFDAPNAITAFTQIDRAGMSPGARLIAEREVARRFGVEPAAIRAAPGYISAMESLGAAPLPTLQPQPSTPLRPPGGPQIPAGERPTLTRPAGGPVLAPGTFFGGQPAASPSGSTGAPGALAAGQIQRRDRTDAQFAQEFGPAATAVAQRLGTTPQAVLAHWSLESRNGAAFAGRNNPANMTGTGGENTTNGGDRDGAGNPITQRFLNFDSPEAFADRYVSWVQRRPEVLAAVQGSDARGFAEGLRRGGYATSPVFTQNLAGVAERFQRSGAAARTGGTDFAGSGAPPTPVAGTTPNAYPAGARIPNSGRLPGGGTSDGNPVAAVDEASSPRALPIVAGQTPEQAAGAQARAAAALRLASTLQTTQDFAAANRARSADVGAILDRLDERQSTDRVSGIASTFQALRDDPNASDRDHQLSELRKAGGRFADVPEATLAAHLDDINASLGQFRGNYAMAAQLLRRNATHDTTTRLGRVFFNPGVNMNSNALAQEIGLITTHMRRDGNVSLNSRSATRDALKAASDNVGAVGTELERTRARMRVDPSLQRFIPALEAQYNGAVQALARAREGALSSGNQPLPNQPTRGSGAQQAQADLEAAASARTGRGPGQTQAPGILSGFGWGTPYGMDRNTPRPQ